MSKLSPKTVHLCHSRAQMIMKSVFSFVLYGIILSYLYKLEKNCNCSNNKIHDALKYGAMVFLVIAALGLVPALCPAMNDNLIVVSVIGLSKLIYLILLIVYIWKLKNSNCKSCSDDWRRLGLEVYVYLVFAMLLIAFLYPFIVLAMYTSCKLCNEKN